jgi:hypothetical protein
MAGACICHNIFADEACQEKPLVSFVLLCFKCKVIKPLLQGCLKQRMKNTETISFLGKMGSMLKLILTKLDCIIAITIVGYT